ncbi:MAG: translation elongation factor Ts, partial [Oscillospiraceae bacterium]
VNAETDFVAKNAVFQAYVADVAAQALASSAADMDSFMAEKWAKDESLTVKEALSSQISIIGENMKIARFAVRTVEAGALSSYIHMGGKIGVLCEFSFDKPETASADAFKTFAHDVAMQVAATAPVSARREDVPAEIVEREKAIYMAQAAESGKPEAIQEKMAVGRLEKFFKGSVLNEQEFIKDSNMTVKSYSESVSKELGDTVKVIAFDRLVRGESDN